MNAVIYNQKGEESGKIDLPEGIFGLPWNANLVHQVALAMRSNMRSGTAHAKGRGEVSGGGKKPWKQKGTGRARHGSRRSPIWIGGGVTHGPLKEKDYSKKINKKMKQKALLVSLSQKFRDGEIMFTEAVEVKEPRTKEAFAIFKALQKVKDFESVGDKRGRSLILITDKNEKFARAARNLPYADMQEARNLNVLDVLSYKYLIMPQDAVEIVELKNKNEKAKKVAGIKAKASAKQAVKN